MIQDLLDCVIAAWKTSTRPTTKWVTSTAEIVLAKRPLSHGTVLYSEHCSRYANERYVVSMSATERFENQCRTSPDEHDNR